MSHNYALYSIFYNKFSESKVSRIRAKDAEHFCLFPMGAVAKMLSTRNCSRNISKTMWLAGSNGQRKKACPSSAWKTLFSSTGVHWSRLGLRPRSMITPRAHKFLWRAGRSIMEGQFLIGADNVELYIFTTVNFTKSVLPRLCFSSCTDVSLVFTESVI